MTDSLQVALLSPCFWPEVRRGGERFVHELGIGLNRRGHRARLITSHRGAFERGVEEGLPLIRLPRPPDGRLERRRFEHHLTHVPLTYAALRGGRYDVAHAVYPTDALAAARWTAKTGRPSVLSYLGIPDRVGLVNRRRRVEITQKALEGCTAVTALSKAAADEFWRTLGYEARVIPPGVDVDSFRPDGVRAEQPTIFCAADPAEPRKRVDLLVEAFALVRRDRPDARLVLSRPRDPEVARQLSEAADGVEVADVDDRAALARAYGEAWVSALPSFGEAFGLVLVESLACGTPAVGAHAGAIPEVLDRPEVGRTFSPSTPEALAAALLEGLELGQDPATASACRARAEEFSTDRFVERHVELYAELGA